jgi:uncharacterized membrane protein
MSDPSKSPPFSIQDAFQFGWATTRQNFKPLLALGAVGAFLTLLHQALIRPESTGLGPVLALVVQAAQLALTLVYTRSAFLLHDGGHLDFSKPAELLRGFFTYLLTNILLALLVAFGTMLLIVPGVFWALKYGLAPFLVADDKVEDPLDAFRVSARLTEGSRGHLLVFGLAVIGANIVGAIALGIGLLVTVPMTLLAVAYVIRRLQAHAPVGGSRSSVLEPSHAIR